MAHFAMREAGHKGKFGVGQLQVLVVVGIGLAVAQQDGGLALAAKDVTDPELLMAAGSWNAQA